MGNINAFFNKKPIYWFSAGTMIRQLVSFIMLPIYTSYLSPADYGVLSLLLVTVSIFELFLAAQFGRAIPKFYYDKERQKDRDSVVVTALSLTVPISLVGVIAFYFSAPVISEYVLERKDIATVVAMYSVILCTSTIESYVMMLFRLKEHIAFFFFTSLIRLFIQLSLNIYFVVILETGLVGVLYSSIIVSLLFALLSLVYTFKVCHISVDKGLVKPLFVFTWPLWFAGLGSVFVTSSSHFIIKELASVADVGLYQLANKFGMIISLIVWTPFSHWWQTERFKIVNNESRRDEFPLIFQCISFVLVMSAIGISFLSPLVLKMMVAPDFYPSVDLIPMLCFHFVLMHLGHMYNLAYLYTEKTKVMANVTWLNAVLIVIFLSIATYFYGIVGAMYGYLLSSAITFLLNVYLSKKQFDLGYDFTKTFTFIVLSFLAVILLQPLLSIDLNYTELVTRSVLGILLIGGALTIAVFSNKDTRHFLFAAIKR
ncbi:oligosaccharide flippase family protein [Alteromonas ponticola]|uniref:Oligosaccharide flippase family protein n=1 Tax=Alteromonas aquimaris TaxID=2998417 RepID=A0ABT3P3C3_9ALTE|nr:oligosaccharide flippase family protein [Alteromonas aquimaris]MCW8107260.1 oligosaccharide flippase family protein [Alteromonas aquimaris]